MSEKEFAFTDAQGFETNLQELDIMLFSKKQSTICFARDKNHLVFNISPSKETHRHVNFIRDDLNFKTWSRIVGKIFNLSFDLEHKENYNLCRFKKNDSEKNKIFPTNLIVFDHEQSILGIKKPGNSENIFSIKVALIENENDLFEVVSFISTFFNCVAREQDSSRKKTIVYKMIPF